MFYKQNAHPFKAFKFSNCPDQAIIQVLPTDVFDYSDRKDLNEAIEEVMEEFGQSRAEVEKYFEEYTKDEVMAAALDGYGWPEDLGFVVELDNEEE